VVNHIFMMYEMQALSQADQGFCFVPAAPETCLVQPGRGVSQVQNSSGVGKAKAAAAAK